MVYYLLIEQKVFQGVNNDEKVKSYFYKISNDVLNHEDYLKLKNNNYIGEFKANIHNQNINLKVLSPKDNDYLKYVKSII